MNEERFYDADSLADFSADVSELTDTFKYLVSCVVHNTNPEDAEKLTPELLEEFENIKGSFEDYISAFNYYSVELELFQKAEAEGRAEEIRENFMQFTKEVAAEVKKRF